MKIGIIGLGSIGMRHANNLKAMGHEIWGFDPDDKKMMTLISNGGAGTGFFHGDQSVVTDRFADMLDYFDAIIIASPTDLHGHHLAAVCQNKKPCFVEKPIGGAKFIHPSWVGIATSYVKMVGYNLRFHGCVKKAKEWLDEKLIGRPLWANFTLGQHSIKEPYLRDGVILNWSHEIDLALYLLGSADVAASSTRLTDGKDDLSDILLTHKNGCRSAVHLDYLTEPQVRQGIIAGSNGQIIFDLVNRQAWLRAYNGGVIDQFTGDDDWNDNYIEEMEAFLDRAEGKETLGCTSEEALEVLKICLEVRKQAGLE